MLSTRSLVTLVPKLFEKEREDNEQKQKPIIKYNYKVGSRCVILGWLFTLLGLCLYGIADEVVWISLVLGSSERPCDPSCCN